MTVLETLRRRVEPIVPPRMKGLVKEVARRAAAYLHSPPLPLFGELPPNFLGEQRVKIGHKEFITAADFPLAGPFPWLDRPSAEAAVEDRVRLGTLTRQDADRCLKFSRDGYLTLEKLVPESVIDAAMDAYVRGRRDGTLPSTPGDRRYLDPHQKVPEVAALIGDPNIVRWVELLLDRPSIRFQSIGAEWGSEQLEHSDAIHMTTYPLGYLVAAWVACEDIDPDSGPLVYYPGSHKLPYYLSKDVGVGLTEFRERSYTCYIEKYEPFIQKLIKDQSLRLEYLHAKKGDVLLWHHNLIHGGSPIKNKELTRKSMVFHYFAQGAFCYHDLTSSRIAENRLR